MRTLSAGGKQRLILCVDDDQSVLTFLKSFLECDGYTVLTAANGPDALELLASHPVNAVVLDYDMPGMNGAQVAFKMRQLKPYVPKLLFTAYRTVPPEAAPHIEGFCSKMDRPHSVLTWLQILIAPPETASGVSLHTHIAIARLAPEWGA